MAAKNAASEKALRDIIIHRMLQSPKSQPLKIGGDATQPNAEQNSISKFCSHLLNLMSEYKF